MKVLQVCAFAAPYEGNFIKLLKQLRKELNDRGDEMIFAFPDTAKGLQWINKLERETYVYYLPLAHAYLVPNTYRILKGIYLQHPDIEIVHSHFELYDIPVEKTAPKNVRVFWHLHDAIEAYDDIKNRLLCKLQYGFLYGKSTLLSVSEVHAQYAKTLGFPSERIYHIPNGIDISRIERTNDFSHKNYDFLLFGWDYRIKGVDLCLKAAEMINIPIKIAIVGQEKLADEIKLNHVEINENIVLLRPTENVNELYSSAKCFLHISRFEGQSYALLEAAYSGLQIICSDIPANKFASIFPSVTMIESENVQMLSETMMKVLATTYNDQNVNKTRQIIQERYSVDTWVDNILTIYNKLV